MQYEVHAQTHSHTHANMHMYIQFVFAGMFLQLKKLFPHEFSEASKWNILP